MIGGTHQTRGNTDRAGRIGPKARVAKCAPSLRLRASSCIVLAGSAVEARGGADDGLVLARRTRVARPAVGPRKPQITHAAGQSC